MFTSTTTTTSDYSILDCPPLTTMPLVMDTTTTKWKCTNIELAPNCPRCASTNTKFCYYNNYSLSQPRYFCKACRRYWTKGGSLRNVPVGGGCRKSRRARASSKQIGPPNYPGSTPGPGGADGPTAEPCIDLAAVFAKYVNQQNVDVNNNNDNNNNNNEESFSPGASSGSSDNYSQAIEDISMFEYEKVLINGVPELSAMREIDGRDYVYQDFNGFDDQVQQGISEMAGDVLWTEEGTSLPDFGSEVQPVMQVQDFGLFSPDDQFRISANLVADNWASFDPSAYEFFSNP